jgi:hypothetical protein
MDGGAAHFGAGNVAAGPRQSQPHSCAALTGVLHNVGAGLQPARSRARARGHFLRQPTLPRFRARAHGEPTVSPPHKSPPARAGGTAGRWAFPVPGNPNQPPPPTRPIRDHHQPTPGTATTSRRAVGPSRSLGIRTNLHHQPAQSAITTNQPPALQPPAGGPLGLPGPWESEPTSTTNPPNPRSPPTNPHHLCHQPAGHWIERPGAGGDMLVAGGFCYRVLARPPEALA